jgi:hypothetical protein
MNLAVGFSAEGIPALHPRTKLWPIGTVLFKGIYTYSDCRHFCDERLILYNMNLIAFSVSVLESFRLTKFILYRFLILILGTVEYVH